jgi:hypothetical protein
LKIEYYSGTAYFPEIKACVCADIHIGIEDSLQAEGFSMPLNEEQELLGRFRDAIKRFKPHTFVLNGDILHEFHRIRKNTKKSFDRIILELVASVDDVVLVAGSHDKMLDIAIEGLDGVVKDYFYFKDGVLFTHGDSIPEKANERDVRLIVLGHDHPTMDIDLKKEPCYLFGEKAWRGKDVLVLPAFNPLCSGTSINSLDSSDFLSEFIRQGDIGRYKPILTVGEEVLEFPMLKEFRDILNVG